MATSKHINKICVIALIAALLITVLFMNGQQLGIGVSANAMGYESRLFDTSRVHTIDIVIDDWEAFVATAQSEEYSLCSVIIDGESFPNVGIRGKGNTSLSTVASMGSDRYSFKIEFDQYDSTKTYYGLDKLSLNNLIQDNTMMKDYLTYRMMGEFGVATPLCSYVYITVNGEDWGLYLAVEAVEESFLQRNYGKDYGQLYKPDSVNMAGDRGNGQGFEMAPVANQADRGMGTDDVKLQYIGDQLENYANIFIGAKTEAGVADHQRLVQSLRALSEGVELETVVDMEAVLRYFVVHNFVVNADSYTGSMVHNYYLYEKDGQLAMIPWDYNLAYGTFQSNDSEGAVNDDIDAPLSVGDEDRPMVDWIYNNEDYTQRYHALFREFLKTVDAGRIIDEAQSLIGAYVKKDPTKFCTYEEFQAGVETLRTFCGLRSESVSQQLEGKTGSVDASSIKLSAMGTMGSKEKRPSKSENIDVEASNLQQLPGGQGGIMPPAGMENMRPGQPDVSGNTQAPVAPDITPVLVLAVTVLILAAGLIFAFKFRR